MPHRPSHRRLANIDDIEAILRRQHAHAVTLSTRTSRAATLYPDSNVAELAEAMVPSSSRGAGRAAALRRARADATVINRDSRRRVRRVLIGITGSDRPDALRVAKLSTRKRAGTIARTEKKRLLASILSPERLEQGFTHVRLSDGVDYDDACRAANGSVWTIAQYRAHPTQHPNCRRAVEAWLEGPEGKG